MTPEMLATLTEQVAELVQTYSNNFEHQQKCQPKRKGEHKIAKSLPNVQQYFEAKTTTADH